MTHPNPPQPVGEYQPSVTSSPIPPKRHIRSALPRDMRVKDHRDLCLALGGDDTSFTGDLLRLIAKADPGNTARLRLAFPGHVRAWELWMALAPSITAGELVDVAERAEEGDR